MMSKCRRPKCAPSRVASSSPAAPPPTTTIWVLRTSLMRREIAWQALSLLRFSVRLGREILKKDPMSDFRISLDKANTIITAAFAKGKEAGMKPLSCVVVDAGGHVIAFQRQ